MSHSETTYDMNSRGASKDFPVSMGGANAGKSFMMAGLSIIQEVFIGSPA